MSKFTKTVERYVPARREEVEVAYLKCDYCGKEECYSKVTGVERWVFIGNVNYPSLHYCRTCWGWV